MINYDAYKNKICKHDRFDSSKNISDCWFEIKNDIQGEIFSNNGEPDLFGLIVRWESDLGEVCTKKLREYINNKIEEGRLHRVDYIKIDFADFKFIYNGILYNLERFCQSFPTSEIYGWADLRGINLQGIRIDSCCFVNCMFFLANFKGSSLQQLMLINTNFGSANFENARLTLIKADDESTLNGINAKNAFINAINFNDKLLGDNAIRFNEVSYWVLLKWSFLYLINRFDPNEERRQTIFQANSIKHVTAPELAGFVNYVKWFQYIYKTVYGHENITKCKKIQFFFEVLLTKYWRSFSALGIVSLCINIAFALIYLVFSKDFNNGSESFFGNFYYSIVTFTTLGYGDIYPKTDFTRMLVIIEVLLGYVTLGLFVFLLSKKVEVKF